MHSTAERHPEALLKAVLDNVGVALAVIDTQGRVVFTNQAALQMYGAENAISGVSFQEWRKNYVFRDRKGHPIPLEQAPVVRALAGEEVPPLEIDVILPDGRRKWLHVAAHPFSIFGMAGVFVIVTDETEQVRLRRALEQAQNHEVFGLMVAALAHDLNNMLSVISGNVALLREERIPEAAHAQLEQMTVALQRGAALTKRLAAYKRTQQQQLRPVQINDLVNIALHLVNPLLRGRIRVKAELGLLPEIKVDPSQIEQVLVNLILNAIDAMPEGGELTLRTEKVEGALADMGGREASFVCIRVADSGIGIPEAVQTKIFDPFFTTKQEGEGSGLGLASAQAIVRLHSGHIRVKSAPNAGAKFSIYLPLEQNTSSRERAA
jgi:PAS domain S-box-containing protein